MNVCRKCNIQISETKVKGVATGYCSGTCRRAHYYLLHKEKESELCKKWYQKNRVAEIEKNKEYRKQNRELFDWYHNKDRFDGMKDVILTRDEHKCRSCGTNQNVIVHHIDGTGHSRKKDVITNNDIKNLISLCSPCHTQIHHWQKRKGIILQTGEDIVRTLAKVKEGRRPITKA